jgi:hypothetical protein
MMMKIYVLSALLDYVHVYWLLSYKREEKKKEKKEKNG